MPLTDKKSGFVPTFLGTLWTIMDHLAPSSVWLRGRAAQLFHLAHPHLADVPSNCSHDAQGAVGIGLFLWIQQVQRASPYSPPSLTLQKAQFLYLLCYPTVPRPPPPTPDRCLLLERAGLWVYAFCHDPCSPWQVPSGF